jgi:hypothetical protein
MMAGRPTKEQPHIPAKQQKRKCQIVKPIRVVVRVKLALVCEVSKLYIKHRT